MEKTEVYEPPTIVEIGDFAELTRSSNYGTYVDGYYTGWYYRDNARG